MKGSGLKAPLTQHFSLTKLDKKKLKLNSRFFPSYEYVTPKTEILSMKQKRKCRAEPTLFRLKSPL